MARGGSKRVENDFRIACGFFAHLKTKKLRRALGGDGVIGLMKLWAWCATQRTDGNLAGLSDEDIEDAIDWADMGTPGELVPVLVGLRFIDGPAGERVIHDWLENNPYVASKPARVERARKGAAARWNQPELPLDPPPEGGQEGTEAGGEGNEKFSKHAPSIETGTPSTPVDACSNALEQCPQPNPTQPNQKSESPARAPEASPQGNSGAVALALRRAGCPDASDTNPILAKVLETVDGLALIDLAREKPGKPLLYLVNAYRGRLADAQAVGQGTSGSSTSSASTSAGQGVSPARAPEDPQTARAKAEALWREVGIPIDELHQEQGATP